MRVLSILPVELEMSSSLAARISSCAASSDSATRCRMATRFCGRVDRRVNRYHDDRVSLKPHNDMWRVSASGKHTQTIQSVTAVPKHWTPGSI